MKKVKNVLATKANVLYTVAGQITVFEALQQLVDKNIGALVVKEGEVVLGIFTERDYARKVVLKGKSSREVAIKEIMNEHPVVVNSNDSIEHCMELMTDKLVRYLLVIDNDQLVGILSIGDLVKFIIEEQKQTIDHLQNYITGGQ